MSPVPCVLQKLLTRQVGLFYTLLCEFLNHFCLCGDGSVIRSGHPKGIFAHHARAADKYVLDGVVEHVAHMKHSCHIRRRDYYCIRLTRIGHGFEKLMVKPIGIPFVLHFRWIIFRG